MLYFDAKNVRIILTHLMLISFVDFTVGYVKIYTRFMGVLLKSKRMGILLLFKVPKRLQRF